ncbi:unnamed protein product [Spirodela intermedia]|uniref:BHLH domain-containing protein n=1 Tax=Spirodela intermedia TaxID=51605 RepID=A0A7I8IMK6_SPIIN|nr:unnamed protein product [Spirodela intermedia]CAA6659000.1 unnamed protein product [Spirodela intermedia]
MDLGPSSSTWEEGEEAVSLFWSFADELSSLPSGVSALMDLPPLPPSLLLPPPLPPLPVPPPALETVFEGYWREERKVAGYTGGCSVKKRRRRFGGEDQRGQRGFRHMISERRRREKLSKSYTDLRSLLPSTTKSNKISIVTAAISYLRSLMGRLETLRRRNRVLGRRIAVEVARGRVRFETIKLPITAATASLATSSLMEALRRLKAMEARPRTIRWSCTGEELVAGADTQPAKIAEETDTVVTCVLVQEEEELDDSLDVIGDWSASYRGCMGSVKPEVNG